VPDDVDVFLNADAITLRTFAKFHANAALVLNQAAEAKAAGNTKAYYEAMLALAALADQQTEATKQAAGGSHAVASA
jgi:hypothetical protein